MNNKLLIKKIYAPCKTDQEIEEFKLAWEQLQRTNCSPIMTSAPFKIIKPSPKRARFLLYIKSKA